MYSRKNPPEKIKNGAYIINVDEHADVGTHWIALFCNKSEIVSLDSFAVEHVPEEIKNLSEIKTLMLKFFEYKQTIQ